MGNVQSEKYTEQEMYRVKNMQNGKCAKWEMCRDFRVSTELQV